MTTLKPIITALVLIVLGLTGWKFMGGLHKPDAVKAAAEAKKPLGPPKEESRTAAAKPPVDSGDDENVPEVFVPEDMRT